MKRIILMLSLIIVNYGFSQAEDSIKTLKTELNVFYILDVYWTPPHTKEFKTDNSPNYIQVNNNVVMITGRIRNNEFYFHGKIQDIKHNVTDDGTRITSFYAIGKELSNGKMASFQLIEKTNGELIVNYFSKYKTNNFFKSHHASQIEIEEIKSYWKNH